MNMNRPRNGFINTFLSKSENHSLTPEEIIENSNLIKDAYHTLLDHFMKEEQVLYPMAEKLFSKEEGGNFINKGCIRKSFVVKIQRPILT